MESASVLIDEKIRELGDWRGKTLAKLRKIIHEADPEIVEEWKWRGTPVWSHGGIVCTGETYKNVVKMTFAKGAALQNSSGLFNSSLDGNVRRAIDIREGDKVDEAALKDLIRAAVALNLKSKSKLKPRQASSNQGRLAFVEPFVGGCSNAWAPDDAERHAHKATTWPLKELLGESRQRKPATNRRRRPRDTGSKFRGRAAGRSRLLAQIPNCGWPGRA
jgi:hypothetical protein